MESTGPDHAGAEDPRAPRGADLTTRFVRRAKGGDDDSTEWVIGRFTPYLHVSARHRIPSSMQAWLSPEDLVQEVWAITLAKFRDLQERGGRLTPVLLSFMNTVLLNKYRDHLREFLKTQRVGQPTTTTERASITQLPDQVTGVITRSIRSEHEALLWKVLDELDDADRQIAILRGIEQLPYAEISVILGEPPDTLRHRFRRVLPKLRERLPDSLFHEIDDE